MNNPDIYPDALEDAKNIDKIVVYEGKRKYFGFREPAFEGDLCCADAVGCNLSCIYCNSSAAAENPGNIGEFYSPGDVAEIINKFNSASVKISGGEPTIGKEHMLELLKLLHEKLVVILETNGTLIDRKYAGELSSFKNLHVRVSLKGTTPEEFEKITLHDKSGFYMQINALKHLTDAGISVNPVIINLASVSVLSELSQRLLEIDENLPLGLEYENLLKTKDVIDKLAKNKVFIDRD